MDDDPTNQKALPQSQLDRIDTVCDRFEKAWTSGKRPRLEDFVAELPESDRAELFSELLAIELEYRRRAREEPNEDDYRGRFPEYREQIDSLFATTLWQAPPLDPADPMAATVDRPGLLTICCPSCHQPVDISASHALSEIKCVSCGTNFSLVGEEPGRGEDAKGRRKTIGHFELIEQLGAGAFGAVWKARDTQLDRTVAVKIPRKNQLDREETEKFVREARAAAQLRHRHIVSVHEIGLEGDRIYIVSDFIEGIPLNEWLEPRNLTLREASELSASIAEALHYAHQQGVIHRDLKPANIIMDLADEPHVMDFGLAKRETAEITMTVEGQILGTPAYMSPEQAKGESHTADRRTDVYSLGVILFELLTGERPFRGNIRMLLQQVVEDEPPSPRKLNGRVPLDLETICLKSIEKEPDRRYQSSQALAEDLRRYLAGEPILARPVGSVERTWRWCRRNPVVAGLSTFAMTCLLFGLIASTVGYVRASRALHRESQALSDKSKALQETQAAKAEAETNLNRAEENLRTAGDAVHDLLTQVSETALLDRDGMQPLRRTLLEKARDLCDRLRNDNANTPELRQELALNHYRVGEISAMMDAPSDALDHYKKAGEIQKELLVFDPGNPDLLRELSNTLNRVGRALIKQGKPSEALEVYREVESLRQEVVELRPDDTEAKRKLANILMNMGIREIQISPGDAKKHMEKAQEIRKELLPSGDYVDEQNLWLYCDYAKGYYNLATLALQDEPRRLVEADGLCGKAVRLFERMQTCRGFGLKDRSNLATCYRILAGLKDAQKQWDAANAVRDKARNLIGKLARENPTDFEYQLALADVNINYGLAKKEQGDKDAALESYQQARSILAPRVAELAEMVRYQFVLDSAFNKIADLQIEMNRPAEAMQTLQTLHGHLQKIAEKVPKAESVQKAIAAVEKRIEKLQGNPPSPEKKRSGDPDENESTGQPDEDRS